ncbi:NADH-quinone oxidoreductase subunit L [Fulvitalea axinellae]|uniref:NADH-quinone oxidoreductase subunit L n=1 Tax=Fulvitalea axinellae TaxID=1182444 RepID=A0AAU9CGX9_9BACT|nr:NADH-quinone oxidoreductase subunit L [Fulvitalea axinellae]
MDVRALTGELALDSVTGLALVTMLLPLISFVVISLFKTKLAKRADLIGVHLQGLSFLGVLWIFFQVWGREAHHARWLWFEVGTGDWLYRFTAGVLADDESVLLAGVVTLVSFLVHLFSVNYMKDDTHYARYFSLLGLFTFSMLGIVYSDNLLLLFIFWELVGFSSYLLIGFWFQRSSAARASRKAFLTNRVGDAGFLLGLSVIFAYFGTFDLQALVAMAKSAFLSDGTWVLELQNGEAFRRLAVSPFWMTVAGLGLFCGTIGKSAQFPLQVWLPDAMKGPTPVSALIHAATMVAAGVYLLVRIFPLLSVDVLDVIAIIGGITAFMSAFAALSQNDIKKVLAFSTSSQLGFMVMGMGVGAYDAAYFHLVTHAFFKAGLFLSAGAIIRALHQVEVRLKSEGHILHFDANDMRYMGGLRKKMPFVFAAYVVTSASLMGIPFFSGFLSKDAILTETLAWAAFRSQSGGPVFFLIPVLGFVSAMLTSVYMGRQILLIFFGDFRLERHHPEVQGVLRKVQGPHWKKKVPLFVLSLLSIGFLFSLNPFVASKGWLSGHFSVPGAAFPFGGPKWLEEGAILENLIRRFHMVTTVGSVLLVSLGLALAYYAFRPGGKYSANYYNMKDPSKGWRKMSLLNWRLDDLYKKAVLEPGLRFADLCYKFDKAVIDGVVRSTAPATLFTSKVSAGLDRAIDKVVDGFGVGNVIIAHVLAFFDRMFVDGFIDGLAKLTVFTGRFMKKRQGKNIQSYLIVALALCLALLAILLF